MYDSWLLPTTVRPSEVAPHSFYAGLSTALSGKTRVALVGAHPAVADAVREPLYRMNCDFAGLQIVDLGNLRKHSVEFAIPLLRELHASGIVPVLLGSDSDLFRAQYLAFAEQSRQVGVFTIDQYIGVSAEAPEAVARGNVLNELVYRTQPPHFHLASAGSQRHLIDPRLPALFAGRHYGYYPLGEARADLTELEPPIRDADVLLLEVSALIRADAPAQRGYHASGFSLQEASQLCFYGGNSDRLSSFGVHGFLESEVATENGKLTAAAYAQLCWYFIYGVSRRFGDFPASTDGMTEYVVDTKVTGKLTFWYSPRSTRWWVAVPLEGKGGELRNRLVACSHRDYSSSSKEGKLPDRILDAFARY